MANELNAINEQVEAYLAVMAAENPKKVVRYFAAQWREKKDVNSVLAVAAKIFAGRDKSPPVFREPAAAAAVAWAVALKATDARTVRAACNRGHDEGEELGRMEVRSEVRQAQADRSARLAGTSATAPPSNPAPQTPATNAVEQFARLVDEAVVSKKMRRPEAAAFVARQRPDLRELCVTQANDPRYRASANLIAGGAVTEFQAEVKKITAKARLNESAATEMVKRQQPDLWKRVLLEMGRRHRR